LQGHLSGRHRVTCELQEERLGLLEKRVYGGIQGIEILANYAANLVAIPLWLRLRFRPPGEEVAGALGAGVLFSEGGGGAGLGSPVVSLLIVCR
jgi:hypothetical protein